MQSQTLATLVWNFDSLEAGLPATGIGGIATNDNIWLNYTYRGSNFVNAKIYARSNQIVPAGIVIKSSYSSNKYQGAHTTRTKISTNYFE
jgi:hypothetical protein